MLMSFHPHSSVIFLLPIATYMYIVMTVLFESACYVFHSFLFGINDGNAAGNFDIDNTGKIFLLKNLDAMVQDAYTLTIVASNMANPCQCGKAIVKISVLASNSNPPIFIQTTPVSISETTPVNTAVVNVTATDADSGVNGEIRYSIIAGNSDNAFAIDPITGVISVIGALNHTHTPLYTLTVEAVDQAVSPLTGVAMQVINIVDVNQRPYFITACATLEICRFMVYEGTTTNTTIKTITARDPDSPSIPNGQLIFNLAPSNTPFTVDSDGNFILVTTLDRESQESYIFNLTVTDRGTPSLAASTVVIFNVTDNVRIIIIH